MLARNYQVIQGIAGLLILLFCIQTSNADSGGSGTEPAYVMGVFPHLPPRELEKVFAPMAADLGQTIGREVFFRSSTTYEKFSEQLSDGKYDIAFIQPFDYVAVAGSDGYLPLATRTQRLSAILVTKTDSALSDMQSLEGKEISLPPESAAVSILVKDHFRRHGLIPGKDVIFSHHRSHVSCMQKVLIGETDACGTAAPALRYFQKRMQVNLKTVARTMDIPHTLFTIHSRIPKEEKEKIKKRIVNWGNTQDGQKILATGSLKPFVEINDADYDIVRDIIKNQ